jgi:hypothetical protein
MGKPLFTLSELAQFGDTLGSKFRDGVRSETGLIYIVFTIIGVAWASYAIPAINRSELSPETLGIYVIGFVISVILDAMILWKKGSENKYEVAISITFMIASIIFLPVASYLSLKSFKADSGEPGTWRAGAEPLLVALFVCTIFMSLVLTGLNPEEPNIGPLDVSLNSINDRK